MATLRYLSLPVRCSMRILSLIDTFIFNPDRDTRVQTVFRVALGCQLFAEFLLLAPSWLLYFADPPISEHYHSNLFSISDSAYYLYTLLCVGVGASLTLALGFHARLSAVTLFLLQRSMVLQSPVLVNGHDYVFTVLLFCAMWMPLGTVSHFSTTQLTTKTIFTSMWARRLAQVLFVLMYLSTGISKPLDDVHWRNGTAIAWITLSSRWSSFPSSTFLIKPYVSMALTYYTLAVEILAPLLVWIPRLRLLMILAMCSLHLGIIMLMDSCILLFNTGSMTWAILFAKDEDLRTLSRWLKNIGSLRRFLVIKKRIAHRK